MDNYKHTLSPEEMKRREILRKRKKRIMRNRYIVLQTIIFILVAAAVFSAVFIPGNKNLVAMEAPKASVIPPENSVSTLNKIDYKFLIKTIENINSSNAIFIELSSGETMAEKLPDDKIYPASLTKIMTAIIVLEHFGNLEEELTVPQEIYTYLVQENASVAGFYGGESVRIIDLLYGVLLPSGAEACLTLANAVSGNEVAFAKKMTEKAHSLGAINTNFVNSTGLHDDAHYTTVRDISIILTYALKNETFKTIFTTEKYTTPATNKHNYGVTMNSTTFSAFKRAGLNNTYVKGGKTGFTGEAKLCLASYGVKNGREYILVTVGAGNGLSSRGTQQVQDANYIYDNYA